MSVDKLDTCRRLISYATYMRKANGITTKKASEESGVKSQYISKLESGRMSPTLTSFVGYIDSIGCEIEIVRKDSKNSYRKLAEQLVDALDSQDKAAADKAAKDINWFSKKELDKSLEAGEGTASADADLLLTTSEGKDVSVTIETTKRPKSKAVKEYSKKLKGGK